MPDWLLTVPRLVWAPARWVKRKIQRRALDRQALVREGSEVLTPVIQLAKSLGPNAITWGADEENQAYLQERKDSWLGLRESLLTYANQHPSDAVRALAHDVNEAVWEDLRNTAWLLRARRTERLMVEIRRY